MKRKLHCVLLIEDNYMTSLYNEKIIEELCIANHIVSTEDGDEALSFLESNKKNNTQPELILLDIYMPGMNGWEFINRYKKLNFEKDKTSAIVVLTHSHDSKDEKIARSIPEISEYLTKPLSEKLMTNVISKLFLDAGTMIGK